MKSTSTPLTNALVAAFRVVLFVLAIGTSWGQFNPFFACASYLDPAPKFIRAEGKAELVKDVILQCTGGNPGTSAITNVQVFLNTNVSSRVLNDPFNEALLFINEPASPTIDVNTFQGRQSGPNAIVFVGVPIPTPASGGVTTLRITNVRADATRLNTGISSNEPPQVNMYLSITGTSSVPINNPQRTVGIVVPSLNFCLRSATDTAVFGLDLQQQSGQNVALVTAINASGGTVNHLLKFSELFTTTFNKRNTATSVATPTALANQSTLGTNYNSESGYYNTTFPATNGLNTAGLATNGTRLMVRFNNIPAGVALYATISPIASASSVGVAAKLIATGANGAGVYNEVTQTTTASCTGCTAPVGISPITLVNGSGTAVWELLSASATDLDQLAFGLVVAYASPKTGTTSVSGSLAPLGSSVEDHTSASVPRFEPLVSATAKACSNSNCLLVPSSINLTYQKGSGAAPSSTIPIRSTDGPLSYSATAISGPSIPGALGDSPAGSWLSVNPSSLVTPASLTVTVDPASLPVGVFVGYISVLSPGSENSPQWVYVQLTVTAASGGIATSSPMVCTTNAGVPLVRAEGATELIGDFVLNCTGGTPTANGVPVPITNVQLSLNTEISSRLLNSNLSEALLLMDEPSPFVGQVPCTTSTCTINGVGASGVDYLNGTNTNIFQGRITGPGQLSWSVPIDAPGAGNTRVVRFTNLRANVTRIGISSTIIPNQVFAFVSAPGISIQNSKQTVGFIQPGKTSEFAEWGGNKLGALTFLKAGGANASLIASSSAVGGIGNFVFTVKEGFASVFKKRNAGTTGSTPLSQNSPGSIYNTESYFYNPLFVTTNGLNIAGLASQGTRLMAKFDNVPAGVKLYATVRQTNTNSPAAQLTVTDAQGAGTYAPVAQTSTALFGTTQFGIAPITITNGSAVAVWEITTSDALQQETIRFGILAAYSAPVAGSAALAGLFAPTTTLDTADATAPIPRFDGRGLVASGCFNNCSVSSPSSLSATAVEGSTAPAPQTISFTPNGIPFFAKFSTNQPWLSVNPAGAILPASVTVSFDTSGLTPGTYSGAVNSDSGASIPVTLTVTTSGAITKASLTSPLPGSALTSSPVTFNWNAGVNVTQYQLTVGTTGIGSSDVYIQAAGTSLSQLVTNLPTDSRTLYVRLGSFLSGTWRWNDYTFIAGSKTVSVTINSVPSGAVFSSEGQGCDSYSSHPSPPFSLYSAYTTPQTLTWAAGANCIVTSSYVPGQDVYSFVRWEDNSVNPVRTIAAPATAATYTANFQLFAANTCQYTLGLTSLNVGPTSGIGTWGYGTNRTDCTPALSSNVVWLSASPSSANILVYTYEANFGPARTGNITVGDKTFSIIQAASTATPTDSGPVTASGSTQTFILKFSHPQGYQQLGVVNALINQYLNGDGACYIAYSQPLQVLYLVNDQGPGSGLSQGLTLGATGSVSNSQCTIFSSGSSTSSSGNVLTLTLNVSFKAAFTGNKVIYLAAQTVYDVSSGWQTLGVSQIPEPSLTYPRAAAMSPATGTTSNQTLSFTYQDANSANNLQTVWALTNTSIDGRQACYVAYYAPGNMLYLYPDNGDGAAATNIPLTGTNTIQNSQCQVSAVRSSVVKTGNQLTLNLNMTFNNSFTGAKGIWTAAQTLGGVQTSPWKAVGAWLVP